MEGSLGSPDAKDFPGMDGRLMKSKEVGRPIYDRNTLMRDLFLVLADHKFKTAADLPADSDWRGVGSFEKLMELVQKIDEEDHGWLEEWRKDAVPTKPVLPMFKAPSGKISGGDEPVSLLSFTTELGAKVLPVQPKSSEQNK